MKRGYSSLASLFLLAVCAGGLFLFLYPCAVNLPPRPDEVPWPDRLTRIARWDWSNLSIQKRKDQLDPMGDISRITIHHDGMPSLPMETADQIQSRIVSIQRAHFRRYADIGYHYIIDPRGRVWEGRPIAYQGAHVQGQNHGNIGVMMLGNTDQDQPTEEGLAGLHSLIRYLMLRHRIDASSIHTHRELASTGCPGKMLQEKFDQARERGEFNLQIPRRKFQFSDWKITVEIGREFLDRYINP